ncbi:hypothetical protein [Bosea massiliensis]|uniref:HK97 gp10 family phage protein n=1 Tax=Bosea massiliensis TaxID=151419 RepID=A0ABW0PBV6_9HYPH
MSGFTAQARVSTLRTVAAKLEGGAIRAAAARGLNEHIRLQERQAVRLMAAQTKLSPGRVARVTKTSFAGGGRMEASVDVRDAAIPLGKETHRSWSHSAAGASAGDWRSHTYPSSFIIRRYGGDIFARMPGAKKYPIVRLWGPVLPNELRRRNQPTYQGAVRLANTDLEARVLRHISSVFA